jgi:hypothetical protein
MPENSTVVGIGWYDREQWSKLKQVAADAGKLDDTFEAWLRNAEQMEKEIARGGLTVRRVMVKVDSLVAWCVDRNKPLDGEARADYVAESVQGVPKI